jgi:hypothetical protein
VIVSDAKLTMVMGVVANDDYTMLNYLDIGSTTCNLSCTVVGDGSGSVSSTTPGKPFTCPGGACNQPFTYGDSITLNAAPAPGSLFSGWSGACSGKAECPLTMNSDRSVSAGFAFCPARIGGICYPSLTAAYLAAPDGATLRSMVYTFSGNISMERDIDVTLAGGYDNNYGNNTGGVTTLEGSLSIARGSLAVEKLIIR